MSGAKKKRVERDAEIVRLRSLGLKQSTVAWLVGLDQATVSRVLSTHSAAPDVVRAVAPPEVRFWNYVAEADNGCWEWQGGRYQNYGVFHPFHGESVRAHRYAYEQIKGEIPDGLHLDHLCRNPPCVNPWHLDPVTSAVNTARGAPATKTVCNKGHDYTPENTIRNPRNGRRRCRICRDASNAISNAAQSEARRLRREVAA